MKGIRTHSPRLPRTQRWLIPACVSLTDRYDSANDRQCVSFTFSSFNEPRERNRGSKRRRGARRTAEQPNVQGNVRTRLWETFNPVTTDGTDPRPHTSRIDGVRETMIDDRSSSFNHRHGESVRARGAILFAHEEREGPPYVTHTPRVCTCIHTCILVYVYLCARKKRSTIANGLCVFHLSERRSRIRSSGLHASANMFLFSPMKIWNYDKEIKRRARREITWTR